MSYFQFYFFFFSSRRRHTRYIGDWSSDVCSSDLGIGFANQLHVAVLDSVVHHLDVMTGAVRAHVSTARFAIHLGGNLAENFLDNFPGLAWAAGHQRCTFERAFFPAGNAAANKMNPASFEISAAALRVAE